MTGESYDLTGQLKNSDAESREHEATQLAKRVMTITSNQQTRIEYDGSDNPIYVGETAMGVDSSAGGWCIKKITWTGTNPTLIQTAYGAWDDRATLTYS